MLFANLCFVYIHELRVRARFQPLCQMVGTPAQQQILKPKQTILSFESFYFLWKCDKDS